MGGNDRRLCIEMIEIILIITKSRGESDSCGPRGTPRMGAQQDF